MERRQTRELARLPERLAKPPETPCEGVSFLFAIGGRRLPALHTRTSLRRPGYLSGVLCPLEPCFRATTESSIRTSSGAVATAPSSSSTCSHSRQPVMMPADGWPGPPGGGVTSLARERRISRRRVSPHRPDETTRPHLRPCPSPLLRPRHVSGDAPRRAGQVIICISSRTGQQSYIKEFLLRRPTRLSWPRGEACAPAPLTPAKAGVQLGGSALGPRFRGDERRETYRAAKALSRAGWGRPQLQGDPTRLRAARGATLPFQGRDKAVPTPRSSRSPPPRVWLRGFR